jgi:murein DD-endopeptidase MepM/ murein hydrolase activator NlpD
VREVLDLAKVYDTGGEAIAFSLDQVQVDLSAAQAAVAQASSQLLGAHRKVAKLQRREARLVRLAQAARLLSQRLDYADEAAAVSAALARANAKVATLQSQLDSAKGDLAAARQAATEAQSAGSSARSLLGGTVSASGYVFPVGGGPSVISVSHSHHDYPAADIAAPEGAPLYALEDGVVTNAWSGIDARCGIGFTFRGSDGKTWTYCHMSYREPGVVSGVQLRAGQPVGLVGHTGHATGPHLHLQLQPAVEWPQREDWFSAFAGSAFRWQDAPTPGLDEDDGPSIDFTPAFDLATRRDSGNAFSAPAPEVAPPPAPTETVPSFGDRDPQNPFATG